MKGLLLKRDRDLNLLIFKRNKNYLGINKFKSLSLLSGKPFIALGGISVNNLKKLALTNCHGFAGISFFEQKKGP